ncbi:MAG: DUF4440 domain-containing protein [Planctomycetes bacterium]|nr:DUF4440 domain-containing protein [Planctomycetota bacterium]
MTHLRGWNRLTPRQNELGREAVMVKMRLQIRIKLSSGKPLCQNTPFGTPGLVLLVVLGGLLQPIDGAQEPPLGAETRLQEACLQDIRKNTEAMHSAYRQGNIGGFLSHFVLDTISLFPEHGPLVGRGALHTLRQEEKDKGIRFYGLRQKDQAIWFCGDYLYQMGSYAVTFARPGVSGVVTEFRNGMTIWERQSDGTLMIKLDAYNRGVVPEDPLRFGDTDLAADTRVQVSPAQKVTPFEQTYLFDEIHGIEEAFYAFFLNGQERRAAACYAEEATLVITDTPQVKGREAIAKVIVQGAREGPPRTALEREILEMEGDESMVYVVNQFEWTMRDPSSGRAFTVPGKGVHVWQRQPDHTWKILIDIHNTDVPMGE